MIGEKFGHLFDAPLEKFAKRIPVHPNVITIVGFLLTAFASAVLVAHVRLGGGLVLAAGFFDVLDGVVARVNDKKSAFGAFLDSVLDRYSDAFILLAVGWNLYDSGQPTGLILSLLTLVGAFLISYTRARAEGLGRECKNGLLERPERVVLISVGAMTGLIIPILWVMAVFTHITAFQRIYHVWKVSRERGAVMRG
ncbi:MAG: CDP-alcohol phosphatidyltransferase family protein [Nitrospiraceae bacterium]|nr:CDP-alcohol phosphatidyltransferase family protein [Nitrospiraceae bacterium]